MVRHLCPSFQFKPGLSPVIGANSWGNPTMRLHATSTLLVFCFFSVQHQIFFLNYQYFSGFERDLAFDFLLTLPLNIAEKKSFWPIVLFWWTTTHSSCNIIYNGVEMWSFLALLILVFHSFAMHVTVHSKLTVNISNNYKISMLLSQNEGPLGCTINLNLQKPNLLP